MLVDQVQNELRFNQLPSALVLCEGDLDCVMDTTENAIQMTLQLNCRKITAEDNHNYEWYSKIG